MNQEKTTATLKQEILHLISLRQEGGYWDFKKQWHGKKSDLLLDIICMANNLHNRAAYIIIGIDEKQDYAVVDVKDDPNRRNTQNIVDFLKDKKFAGGVRPLVHVATISLYRGDIDVVVVENSHHTPFYLTERFDAIRANHIYTRVMDTNTPVDSSADINNVEYLWRKRFHLDETPLNKFLHYLCTPDDWTPIQDHNMGYFYKYSPEYTITCEEDDRDGYEYYMFGQVKTQPSWWLITLRYHQTAIDQFLGLTLDGGRSFVIAPQRSHELAKVGTSYLGYYIKDTLRYRLLQFYHKKEANEEHSFRTYMSIVAVFKSETEYENFIFYVKNNNARYKELLAQQSYSHLPSFPELQGYVMGSFKKEYMDALVIQEMLQEFREESRQLVSVDNSEL